MIQHLLLICYVQIIELVDSYMEMVGIIPSIILSIGEMKFQFIHREFNIGGLYLAPSAHSFGFGVHILYGPLGECCRFLDHDLIEGLVF